MLDNVSLLYLAPTLNLQLLLDGLFVGAIFALAAYGLALVWGVMNVKNLAQGDFVIAGGYIAWWLGTQGVHPLFGLPVAAVVMAGFGWLVYRVVISRVVDKDLFTSLLATFGLAIMMAQLLNLTFGSETRSAHAGFDTLFLFDNQVTIAQIRLISLVLCLVLALGLVLFMKRSRIGQAIRATAQDPRAAQVMGIDTDRVYAYTFSLNAAICGVAGALVSMIWVIQPFFGITHSIRAFVIVTAAGLGNLPGVVLAGFGLGVAEQFGGFVLGAEFQQAIVVGMLIAVLIWRQIQMGRKRQVVQ
jgi:branched-chain amino acid transport system permease protein